MHRYDAVGNQTSTGSRSSPAVVANSYSYDAENRLTNAIVGGTNITILYDGDGNRVRKIVGTTTNTFLVSSLGGVCRTGWAVWAQVGTSMSARTARYSILLPS